MRLCSHSGFVSEWKLENNCQHSNFTDFFLLLSFHLPFRNEIL